MNYRFEVWAIGYTKEGSITDFDTFLDYFEDVDVANKFAEDLTLDYFAKKNISIPKNVDYIEIIRELVSGDEVDSESTDLINTLYIENPETPRCPLGGDPYNDCEGCAFSMDYHFENGKCVSRF